MLEPIADTIMPLWDPTGNVEPDFEGPEWLAAKEAIMSSGKSLEEAIEVLWTTWSSSHQ